MDRKMHVEMRLMMLEAEAEAEAEHARADAEAGWYHVGFQAGYRMRKAAMLEELTQILAEEEGARDALSQAFEEQKKYEHVAEAARVVALKGTARRETMAMDEMGLRRAMAGR
jgi:flagellar FliJ protein